MGPVYCDQASPSPGFSKTNPESAVAGGNEPGFARHPHDSEWHAIPDEDLSKPEMGYCVHLIGGQQNSCCSGTLEVSVSGFKCTGVNGSIVEETQAIVRCSEVSNKSWSFTSLGNSDGLYEGREVIVSFQEFQDPKKAPDSIECQECVSVTHNAAEKRQAVVMYRDAPNKKCSFQSKENSDGRREGREVSVSFHEFQKPKKASDKTVYRKGDNMLIDSGHGDEGGLPLFQQLRAFIKGGYLLCNRHLFGDGKAFLLDGWSCLLRSVVSFKSSHSFVSHKIESVCQKSNGSALMRSTGTLTISIPIGGASDAMNTAKRLQVRDPKSRAEALPLAHYRPTGGIIWKQGEANAGQLTSSVAANKLPVTSKKPPKPPRCPQRPSSLDIINQGAQRCARTVKDRSYGTHKSRTTSAPVNTGIIPLIAVVLTSVFGFLIVFQGVFTEPGVSQVDYTYSPANSYPSFSNEHVGPYDYHFRTDPLLLEPVNGDEIEMEAAVKSAFEKSMKDLPWSRSSMASQVIANAG